jgi:hypothetical protein
MCESGAEAPGDDGQTFNFQLSSKCNVLEAAILVESWTLKVER